VAGWKAIFRKRSGGAEGQRSGGVEERGSREEKGKKS